MIANRIASHIQVRNLSRLPGFPECKHTPSIYNGPVYETVKNSYSNNVTPTLKTFYKSPLLIHEGRNQWLWDHKGDRYLDMFAGVATVSVGHCHPKVISAATQQMSTVGHISSIYMTSKLFEYVEKLGSKFPGDLSVVYLVNSGSDATDLAFLMARVYTNANDVISLHNCYHGGTFGSCAATAMSISKYSVAKPSGHVYAMNPDVYRGPWGGSKCRDCVVPPGNRTCDCKNGQCDASDKYVDTFEDIFRYIVPNNKKIAAFIAESIQGIGGVVQYPKTFLRRVYDFVHERGGLCIADEVQTGFGRTGDNFWGFESHGVLPDIVTMAKGIGNGYPLGAVVTTPKIAAVLGSANHFNTFGGGPVACAVGSAVLDVIEKEKLQENSKNLGNHLLQHLGKLMSKYPNVIGDVRGKGLMIGIDLVSNAETRKPIAADHMKQIVEDIKDMGVLVGQGGIGGNVLRIKPPMCVTKEDVDYTYKVIKTAVLKHLERDAP